MKTKTKKHISNKIKRRNATITAAITATVMSGLFYLLMNMRISHMHVVFMFIVGMSIVIVSYMVIWTLSADEKHKKHLQLSFGA